MIKLISLVISLGVCVGCTLVPLNEAKKQEVNDVGVALLIEDSIPVAYMGTTIFNNEASRVNIASWGLNENIVNEMESGLKSIGKAYKKINFDKSKIKQSIENGNTATNRLVGDVNEELSEYLLSAAQDQGAKYLFVFRSVHSDNHPQPKGFGLFCRSAFGTKGDWQAYGLFHVALWDIRAKSKVYQTALDPEDIGFKSGKPCDDIKGTTPDKFASLFKEQFKSLAIKSAQLTLSKSGLLAK